MYRATDALLVRNITYRLRVKSGGSARRPWAEWNLWRTVGAFLWMAASIAGTMYFSFLSAVTGVTLFGERPTDAEIRESAVLYFVAVFVLVMGPLGIWVMRRTRPWLVAAGLLAAFGLVAGVAGYIEDF